MRTSIRYLGAVLAVMLFIGVGLTVAESVAAQQTVSCDETPDVDVPEDQDELLAELRSLEGSSGMEAYSEFELIRSQAALDVQAGEFTTVDQERTADVVRLLYHFEQATVCLDAEEYQTTLSVANETEQLAANLQGEQGAQYRAVADVGLLRFHEDIGGELLSVGEQQNATPERIEKFSLAATAFQRAGAAERFSQLSTRLERVEQDFSDDMNQVNDSVVTAREFADSCEDCGSVGNALSTHGIGVLSIYQSGLDASDDVATANTLLDNHGVQEQAVDEAEEMVTERTTTLALASASIFIGWGTVVGLVAGYATCQLVAWRRDLEASTTGDILLIGRLFNA